MGINSLNTILSFDKNEDLLEAITMFYGKAVKEYKNAKVKNLENLFSKADVAAENGRVGRHERVI